MTAALARRRRGGGKRGAAWRAAAIALARRLVRDHRLADAARFLAPIGRLVGLVISRDLLVGGGDAGDLLGADPGDAQHALLGHHVAAAVGGIEALEVGVGRLEPGAERVDRDDRHLAFARFEQHRGIGRRHADRDAGVGRDRGQQQPLRAAPPAMSWRTSASVSRCWARNA